MTTSTACTVSAEGIRRFAELMAEELGLGDLLTAERWANPDMRDSSRAEPVTCRHHQLRMTTTSGNPGN